MTWPFGHCGAANAQVALTLCSGRRAVGQRPLDEPHARHTREAARKLTAEHVEQWREEQPEHGHAEHPEEHRDAERLTQLRAGPAAERERDDAEDERGGGHEDRAEAR